MSSETQKRSPGFVPYRPNTFPGVQISNFRSFRKQVVDLPRLALLIGPNASGKSNFVEVYRFFQSVASTGLREAMIAHGLPRHILRDESENNGCFTLNILSNHQHRIPLFTALGDEEYGGLEAVITGSAYNLSIKVGRRAPSYQIVDDVAGYDISFLAEDEKLTRASQGIGVRQSGSGDSTPYGGS